MACTLAVVLAWVSEIGALSKALLMAAKLAASTPVTPAAA